MRHTEFWERMQLALGIDYMRVWAETHVMSDLDRRTAQEALDAGVPPKQVWRAVWAALGLPDTDR
nr:DUF3046 domain-containing protein [Nocardioides sp.]